MRRDSRRARVLTGAAQTNGSRAAAEAPAARRYRAFISYSHRDTAAVAWIHRALETYPIPSKLVGQTTAVGPVPRRLTPIFRDRDELPASGDLGAELMAALSSAEFLVVICSPASAGSKWVGEEILSFKRMHGESRVLALIVDGEPYDSDRPGGGDRECFPAPLRYRLGTDGSLSTMPAEPIAADMRVDKDGRRLAKLKLVAGLTGLRLDDLAQREGQRRLRQMAVVTTASVGGMIFAGGLAIYANIQRLEAVRQTQIAQKETKTAKAAADYLIGTYELINPATEDPRKISAITILRRGADRADVELAGQPVIHARIMSALGAAYNNIGLSSDAISLLEHARPVLRRSGPEGVEALVMLAKAYKASGELAKASSVVAEAQSLLGAGDNLNYQAAADVAQMRGWILYSQGSPTEGLASLDKSLEYAKKSNTITPRSIGDTLRIKGLLLSDDGQFDRADAVLSQALAVFRANFGERHQLTGQAWWALAVNDLAAGKLKKAEIEAKAAADIQLKVLGNDNPIVADTVSILGQIYQGEHKLDLAAQALNNSIDVYKRAYRRPHPQIGIALVYLALIEGDRGHLALALADLDDAKHNYDVGYGKLHPNHGDLLVNRATILVKFGRRAEAMSDCAAGIKILVQTLGADAAFTKSSAATCAKL